MEVEMDVANALSADEIRALVDHAAEYFFDKLHALQPRMDDEEWWPDEAFRAVGEMGFMGLTVPPEYGGQGLSYLTAGMIGEAMAAANPAFAFSWTSHDNLCTDAIYRNGTEAQRRRYVPGLCAGKLIGGLGMTEPGAGSDALGAMRTTARREGDHYVLDGTKLYITNGPIADVLLVYAKTAPERGGRGISAFIIEKGFPGFSVAQKLDKMGFRGSPTGELLFQDCIVPAENLVGQENQGHAVMMSGLDVERCLSAPLCVGPAQRALDLAIDHARTRRQFGQPIGAFQLVQAKLADMYVAVETARTFLHRALAACDAMELSDAGRGEIHKLSAAALMTASRAGSFVMNEAVQIFGGSGYMRDTEINRLYRTSKVMEIAAGTQEIRQLIIAKELLGRLE
jgi:isovaleryl-CoA dehydrogenase